MPLDVVELFRSSLIGSRACAPSEMPTIVELVGAGRLDPVVDSVFPLAEVKAAHTKNGADAFWQDNSQPGVTTPAGRLQLEQPVQKRRP